MEKRKIISEIEKLIYIEDFGINAYSTLSRIYKKNDRIGNIAEKIAKEKILCKNKIQYLLNLLKNNKIHINVDEFNFEKFDNDKIIEKYNLVEDDGKPYTYLVKLYNYQRELLIAYKYLYDFLGINQELDYLIEKSQNHFDLLSDFVDVQYEKYEAFSSFWN